MGSDPETEENRASQAELTLKCDTTASRRMVYVG